MIHFQKFLALAFIILTLNNNAAETPADGLSIEEGPVMTVIDWQWGASNTSTTHEGGGGSGKASVTDITFNRLPDSNSPMMIQKVLTGSNMTKVIFRQGIFTIELENVIVTSYSISGATDSVANGDVLRESLVFNFSKFKVTIDSSEVCFDIASNIEC